MWPLEPDGFVSYPPNHATSQATEALYFPIVGSELISISEHGIPRPITSDEFRWLDVEVKSKTYLGAWRDQPCFALDVDGSIPSEYVRTDLRAWLGRVEPGLFYLAGRAKQIVAWHRDHEFCGRCGTSTEMQERDRARECPECGSVSYPRISPSIIVLVCRDDEMLLARNTNWPQGMFSTLAGFVEPGESIEQTVHREVYEEVGIQLQNLRYLGSQSWPFPNSLMLGFHADYRAGEITCLDGEISEAKWFRYDDIPNVPGGTAISRWLIDAFINHHTDSRRPDQ